MHRIAALLFLLPAAWGQTDNDLFSKAPPDVEDALRARIAQFYQLHVDGKYRQAEQLVADDTKDFFYRANKPEYQNFKILRIRYSDTFTKALVTTVCRMFVMMPGFSGPSDVPIASHWKLENGQWSWYVDPEAVRQTAFGRMTPGTKTDGSAAAPFRLPSEEEAMRMIDQVKADRSAVTFKADQAGSEQVIIQNGLPGAVRLTLRAPQVPGLVVWLERNDLQAGEKAAVAIAYQPGRLMSREPVTATILVDPSGAVIPITINFQ